MNDVDIEINTRLMKEFDLEPGARRRVFSHETGEMVTIKGKEIVIPGAIPGKDAIEFDPINSPRLMNSLFGGYVQNLQDYGEIQGDILSYSTVPAGNTGKIKAVMKVMPYDREEPMYEIESKPYNNETSCYADLVCSLNGDTNVDMSHYDFDRAKVKAGKMKPPKPLIKPKRAKKVEPEDKVKRQIERSMKNA